MWLFEGKEFTEDMIGDAYGFVYIITNTINGKKYIGRKYFWSKRTLPPLKGKTRKRHVTKSSDWQNYWSSSKIIKSEIEEYGISFFTREIVTLHPNKTETNMMEIQLQFMLDVLEERDELGNRIYYNENINTKFYPSKNEYTIAHRKQNYKMIYELMKRD